MENWRKQVTRRITTADELKRKIRLSEEDSKNLSVVTEKFRMGITPYYLGIIDKNDPGCPIRKQAVPSVEELIVREGELDDPIGDMVHSPVEGVVHRYPDRALLFPTYECASYCRHCFRRRIAGGKDKSLSEAELKKAIDYIAAHDEIIEVILSGGDPLMLDDVAMDGVFKSLTGIGHVKWIRIHTRVFVTLPQRITSGLVRIFGKYRPIIVIHANHPKELTPEFGRAVAAARGAGVMFLSQSVLLRGVNDSVSVLKELFMGLVECGVKPYYLHHCDAAKGIGHFRVSLREGKELMKALRKSVPGVCMPVYMMEIPGGKGKTPVY